MVFLTVNQDDSYIAYMDNLFILLLLPVFGALVLAFVKQAKAARQLALLISLVSLGLTLPFLVNFVPDASMQFE